MFILVVKWKTPISYELGIRKKCNGIVTYNIHYFHLIKELKKQEEFRRDGCQLFDLLIFGGDRKLMI